MQIEELGLILTFHILNTKQAEPEADQEKAPGIRKLSLRRPKQGKEGTRRRQKHGEQKATFSLSENSRPAGPLLAARAHVGVCVY